MAEHGRSHPLGQSYCDALLDELRARNVSIERKKAGNSCAFFKKGYKRFAYVYHDVRTPQLEIWFAGDPDVLPQEDSPTEIFTRNRVDSRWGRAFPHALRVRPDVNIRDIVVFLENYAIPLAEPPRRKTGQAVSNVHEPAEQGQLLEGAARTVMATDFERNRTARALCIKRFGCKCWICGFDFSKVYGEVGIGFIEVHHIRSIASIGAEYKVDPVADMRPLCPNCHAIVHRGKEVMSCEDVKRLISSGPY